MAGVASVAELKEAYQAALKRVKATVGQHEIAVPQAVLARLADAAAASPDASSVSACVSAVRERFTIGSGSAERLAHVARSALIPLMKHVSTIISAAKSGTASNSVSAAADYGTDGHAQRPKAETAEVAVPTVSFRPTDEFADTTHALAASSPAGEGGKSVAEVAGPAVTSAPDAPAPAPVQVPAQQHDAQLEYDEFPITVVESGGIPVGLDVELCSSTSLLVKCVKPGLVSDWNKRRPERVVKPGDFIVDINGVHGDAARMVDECKSFKALIMKVRRVRKPCPEPELVLPRIDQLRVSLLGGDTVLTGVGKADVAAALIRGITSDAPEASDPIFDFVFDFGVFDRAWGELIAPSGGIPVGAWGIGPLEAWSKGHVHFSSKGPSKVAPPYGPEPAVSSASLCSGSAERLGLGHAKAFRQVLASAGHDVSRFESLHRVMYALAEAQPNTLVRKDRPAPGVVASFARFSVVSGAFSGCGAAILDVFGEGWYPLGNSRNAALLYAVAPNSRAHKGVSPGGFLDALQDVGSNIARLLREYNWHVGGCEVGMWRRAEWLQADLRAHIEFRLSDWSLKTDFVLQQNIEADPERWLDLTVVLGFPRVMAAPEMDAQAVIRLLGTSKVLQTKVTDDGRAFVRHARHSIVAPPKPGPPVPVPAPAQDASSRLGAWLASSSPGADPERPGVMLVESFSPNAGAGLPSDAPVGGLKRSEAYIDSGVRAANAPVAVAMPSAKKRPCPAPKASQIGVCWMYRQGHCLLGSMCQWLHTSA